MTDLSGFYPIATVPRDGRLVIVADSISGESYAMRWEKDATNPLTQPDIYGIWVAADHSFTWSEVGGFGPTHWRYAHDG